MTLEGFLLDAPRAGADQQLRDHLDWMSDGYLALDEDYRITFVNAAAASIVGRGRDELVGRCVWDEFPGADHFRAPYARAMHGEDVAVEEYYEGLDTWFEVRAHAVPGGIAVFFRDVSERKRRAAEQARLLQEAREARVGLAHAATHDALTGLPNRELLRRWLGHNLGGPADPGVALLYVDLDRFKLVNDTHGHAEGDQLLLEAANRLRRVVRTGDLVARIGGDEFVVGLRGADRAQAAALADRLLHSVGRPFLVGHRRLVVTTSVGIAMGDVDSTPDTLLRDADTALHRAKEAGRNRAWTFDEEVRSSVVARLEIEADLREALAAGAIGPHFQPIFDARSGRAVAVEALARWRHPVRGFVPPDAFVPVAEETGLVLPLGQAMLAAGAASLDAIDAALGKPSSTCWVNVSGRQLDEPSFIDDLVHQVAVQRLAGRIGIELTESVLADPAVVRSALQRLAEAGIGIAVDDFGTGFSSLARLADFPVHVLKIDRSFVDGLTGGISVPIVAATIELAHAIGARACAEGVETEEQLDRLRRLGVDLVSGYYLARPVPLDELAAATAVARTRLG